MNFRIIENKKLTVDYEAFKKDFTDPNITIKNLMDKYSLSRTDYRNLREKVLKDTRLTKKPYKTTLNQSIGIINEDTYIRKNNRTGKYYIQKKINGKRKSFGTYTSKDTARKHRDELIKNNWKMIQ